jgi:hypothetical protein
MDDELRSESGKQRATGDQGDVANPTIIEDARRRYEIGEHCGDGV